MRAPPRIPKVMPQHTPRKREGMDSRHLANVRQLPCVTCPEGTWLVRGNYATQAHHLMRSGERGLSLKSPDKYAVPLCLACHGPSPYPNVTDAGNEDAWFAERGLNGRAVAAALWAARSDLEAMRRVIFRARQEASLKMGANA